MRYLHTMLRVKDLDASIIFFCKGLGMKKVSQRDYPEAKFTLIFLAATEDEINAKTNKAPLLELTYNWDSNENYTGGRNFGHLAFVVDDIYTVCAKLLDMGVVINRPPRDGHMAFVRSPDNISIELLQKGNSLPPQEPWTSMENSGQW